MARVTVYYCQKCGCEITLFGCWCRPLHQLARLLGTLLLIFVGIPIIVAVVSTALEVDLTKTKLTHVSHATVFVLTVGLGLFYLGLFFYLFLRSHDALRVAGKVLLLFALLALGLGILGLVRADPSKPIQVRLARVLFLDAAAVACLPTFLGIWLFWWSFRD